MPEYTPLQRRMIDARLAKADEDLRLGRVYGPFNSAQEMAASIEANIKKMRAGRCSSTAANAIRSSLRRSTLLEDA